MAQKTWWFIGRLQGLYKALNVSTGYLNLLQLPVQTRSGLCQLLFTLCCREIKRGNVGLALGEFLAKLRDTMGRKVDYGLVGDRGVAHPSLQVRGQQGQGDTWDTDTFQQMFIPLQG